MFSSAHSSMKVFVFSATETSAPASLVVALLPERVTRKRSGNGGVSDTMIFPDIDRPCTRQWYGNSPRLVKVTENISPLCITPESQRPELLVVVCASSPSCTHFTVSPGGTVRFFGEKKSSRIDTVCSAP